MNTQLSSYLQALQWRYATKTFDPQIKVPEDTLQGLLESLRLSASSFGLQLWKFIVVENAELREQLKNASYGQNQVTDCSHYIIFCSPLEVQPQMLTRHIENTAELRKQSIESLSGFRNYLDSFFAKPSWPISPWLDHQLYIALGNLLSACAVAKVDACPLEGFDHKAYDQILNLHPQNLHAQVACAIGYRSSEDKYAHLAKVRYPLADIVTRL